MPALLSMVQSPLVCPVLVGREAPLRELVDRLERAATGEGRVLLLGGDAGVGKSRIVRELKCEATARAVRVIEGRCSTAESSVPYAPLMDALRFRIARGEGEVAARMLGPLRGILAPLFPQLGESAREPEWSPQRPFELIYSVLERLVADEPALLVFEDIHWADPTSLELLHHLAHRATSLRLLLVATYRSDELHTTHPLKRLLAVLARERSVSEIRLEPLDCDETTELVRRLLAREPDPGFAAMIWRRAEGNPFFVEELVTALAGGVAIESTSAGGALKRARLPSTVSEIVLARVRALGPRALETLSAAAVIGRRVQFDILREILDVSEEPLIETLEQLVAHQLLREERGGNGELYTFPHALMQESLYEGIISRRRRLLHRRVAEAFERQSARRAPTRLDDLAYHFRCGGDHERAYEYARLAGVEAARLHAWDDAAAHYEHALASLEELADDGVRAAELLEDLADVAWRQGRTAAPGRQYVEEALRLRRRLGHGEQTARVLRRLAALRVEDGDDDGASEALEEALRLLGDYPNSPELSAIYDDLGRLSLARGDVTRAERLLLRGLVLASQDANGAEEVLALVSLAELVLFRGDVAAGVARLDLALELLGEEQLSFERASRVYASGVKALLLAHEYDRALGWADAARAACREQGVAGLDALFRALRAVALTITGAMEDTLAEVTAAVEALRRADRSELRDALRALGFVYRARGTLDAARQAYEEALALGDRDASVDLALVALAEGRPATAAPVLERALAAVPREQPLRTHRLLPFVVEAMLATDRAPQAAALVEREAVPDDVRAGAVELLYATGLVRLAQERPTEAREALTAAAADWDALGNRLEGARARIALLDATFADGDGAEGVALGRRLLDELGPTRRERERVRRILRRVGVRTRPDTRESSTARRSETGLTSREEAVLRQVALGRTNREIAQALGIAEKTVSVHVSHILVKLGCRTRTQAARFAPQEASHTRP